jgi:hypothetical protein
MIKFKQTTLIFCLLIFGCTHTENKNTSIINEKSVIAVDDREDIKNLVRQVYKWHESQKPSDNDIITDDKDSFYIGFNLDQLKLNLDRLKATGFFAVEFIDNYSKIFLTINKKLRSGEFVWLVGDEPPFGNDANPWCNCQDVPYDKPNPWDFIEVEIVNLQSDKGELNWKWGKPELNGAPGWKEFRYKFKVVKEGGKWKIAYLQGFNFDEFTRKNY